MTILKNIPRALLSPLKQQPWPLPTATARRIDINKPIEEETSPYYNNPSRFYPARIGEILDSRYQIAGKLGSGSNSTVWLARDLDRWRWLNEKYIALKINTSNPENIAASQAELDIFRHINDANPRHQGWHFIRHILDSFMIEHGGPGRRHLGLVFEPLREPLWIYKRRFKDGVIPSALLKVLLQMILQGLDYLHSECHIIHTDLKPDNIMVKVEDRSILEESARDEYEHPLPQKVYPDGHTIYLSRNNFGSFRRTTGVIKITDFDLSVRGDSDEPNSGCVQAEVYRAPEVIVDAGYSYSADIWGLGVMLWDVLEDKHLFRNLDQDHGDEDELRILTQITALLGPPPKDLLDKGRRTQPFYDSDGTFKGPTVAPTAFNFDNQIHAIQGEDKRMFINFVKRMIKWRPEERSTAKELLQDPWLHAKFD